jgi:HEAT repeat protein
VAETSAALQRNDWLGRIVLVSGAIYFANLVPYGYNLGEDGDVVYLIYRTASGHQPYIDFGSGYTPGFFYFNAALLRLFGANVLVLRCALAVVHSLTLFGLYRLGRAVLPAAWAALPPCAYATLMPVFPGEFATFNIPYPAWYVVLTWVASTMALVRWCMRPRGGWALLAGLLAGVGCAFKPNTGAFNLAALGLLLTLVTAPNGGRMQRLLWWLLLAGVVGALAAVFGFRVTNRDARVLLWPLFALAVIRAAAAGRSLPGMRDAAAFTRAAAALGAGFAAVTAPWMLYYWVQLGPQRFLRDVLFIGSGHELFFYIPIRPLDHGDLLMLAATIGLVVGGRLVQRLRIAPGMVVSVAVVLPVLAVVAMIGSGRTPAMPEGPFRALTQRLEALSFAAALIVHWAGVLVAGRALWTGSMAGSQWPARAALIVGAPALFLSIYPRSDFFHWVLSAPVTLIAGVCLLQRAAQLCLGTRRWLTAALVPAYGMLFVLFLPNLQVAARVRAGAADGLAALHLPRAPLVLESGRAERLAELHGTVDFIERHSQPSDTLLGFPNLHWLNFLSGRHTPARYGHFHPGWPDHILEAQIITAMERHRTPLVTFGDVQLFIGHAPLYYFLLRGYVRGHYDLAARFGRFEVLQRRGRASAPLAIAPPAAPPSPVLDCAVAVTQAERDLPESAESLANCWRSPDARLQMRALLAARRTRDAAGGRAIAEALRDGTIAPPNQRLAVRAIGELGAPDTIAALAAARGRVSDSVRDELDTALFNIVSRAFIDRFVFVPSLANGTARAAASALVAQAAAWLDTPDPRLQMVGAWLAGEAGDRSTAPVLQRLVRDGGLGVQAVAADALIGMGIADGVVEPLLAGLAHDEMMLPSAVLAWSQANPARARSALADTFRTGNEKQRETVAFIAAALGDPAYSDMLRAGLTDPVPRVRCAAVWALGVLGVQTARQEIAQLAAGDEVEQVRVFAREALGWLDRVNGES